MVFLVSIFIWWHLLTAYAREADLGRVALGDAEDNGEVVRSKRASIVLCQLEESFFCRNATHYSPCLQIDIIKFRIEDLKSTTSPILYCGDGRCCSTGASRPCSNDCQGTVITSSRIQSTAKKKKLKKKVFPNNGHISGYNRRKKVLEKIFIFDDADENDILVTTTEQSCGWKPSYRSFCKARPAQADLWLPIVGPDSQWVNTTINTTLQFTTTGTTPTTVPTTSTTNTTLQFTTTGTTPTTVPTTSTTNTTLQFTTTGTTPTTVPTTSTTNTTLQFTTTETSTPNRTPTDTTTIPTRSTTSRKTSTKANTTSKLGNASKIPPGKTVQTNSRTTARTLTPIRRTKITSKTRPIQAISTHTRTKKRTRPSRRPGVTTRPGHPHPPKRTTHKTPHRTKTTKRPRLPTGTRKPLVCPGMGKHSHPVDCEKYIVCSWKNNKFLKQTKICPHGTNFDKDKKQCRKGVECDKDIKSKYTVYLPTRHKEKDRARPRTTTTFVFGKID